MPDEFDGVELGGARRQMDEGDVVRDLEAGAVMPAGAIEDQGDMDLIGQLLAEIAELSVHCFGVGHGHQPSIALSRLGTAGAEQIDELVIGLPGRPGPAAGIGPDPAVAALLAEAGFILKPELDLVLRMAGLKVGQRLRQLIF